MAAAAAGPGAASDGAESDVLGLSALGYQVVSRSASAEPAKLAFPDGTLDAVVNLGPPVPGQHFGEYLRVLRRGGRLHEQACAWRFWVG